MSKSIYVLTMSDGTTKIGISKNPQSRLSQIQSSNPHRVKMFRHYLVKDARFLEGKLHQRFVQFRIRGEWFRISQKELKSLHSELKMYSITTAVNHSPSSAKADIVRRLNSKPFYRPADLDSLYVKYGLDLRIALIEMFRSGSIYIDDELNLRLKDARLVSPHHDRTRINQMRRFFGSSRVEGAGKKYGHEISDHGLDFYSGNEFIAHVGMPYSKPCTDELSRICLYNGLVQLTPKLPVLTSWGINLPRHLGPKVVILKRSHFSSEPFPFLQGDESQSVRAVK